VGSDGAMALAVAPFLVSVLSFLRRVGGSYIFVYRLLMEDFAEMDA